jgi:hypothetical protein
VADRAAELRRALRDPEIWGKVVFSDRVMAPVPRVVRMVGEDLGAAAGLETELDEIVRSLGGWRREGEPLSLPRRFDPIRRKLGLGVPERPLTGVYSLPRAFLDAPP